MLMAAAYLASRTTCSQPISRTTCSLPVPQQPLLGWKPLNRERFVRGSIPIISHGAMYEYLSSGAGRKKDGKSFCALRDGYRHWSSGRAGKIEVNTSNRSFCFVRSVVTPFMKTGSYNVSLLLAGEPGAHGTIQSASCQCVAG